ncbi:uncharacterized protein DFL_004045 [Arthrobotrys flagrans]|uniref:Uncharacterized protein n=1 Tax=Arthrobotrys flagrans TaxID=97331 RepID=A0A437A3Q6_ARTFL|nr:hypothetical protein DFL_004045 [Arthrobotrys flagrans]
MVLVCHYSGPSKLNATSKRGSYFRHFATLNVSTVVRKSYRPANTACLTFAWGWNNQKATVQPAAKPGPPFQVNDKTRIDWQDGSGLQGPNATRSSHR